MPTYHHHALKDFERGSISCNLIIETSLAHLPAPMLHVSFDSLLAGQIVPYLEELTGKPVTEWLEYGESSVSVPVTDKFDIVLGNVQLIVEVTLDIGYQEHFVRDRLFPVLHLPTRLMVMEATNAAAAREWRQRRHASPPIVMDR